MAKNLFIAPTELNTGLTSVCLGLVRALDRVGVRVGFFKPIAQTRNPEDRNDPSVRFFRSLGPHAKTPDPLSLNQAQILLNRGQSERLMEDLVGLYHEAAADVDVVVVEGLVPDRSQAYTARLNVEMARSLTAEVILVAAPRDRDAETVNDLIDFSARLFANPEDPDVIGAILNKVGEPTDGLSVLLEEPAPPPATIDWERACPLFRDQRLRLLGTIPWRPELLAPRTRDLAQLLGCETLHAGEQDRRRVKRITMVARTLPNMVEALQPGTLVVTPGDRNDILLATSMAALRGVPLAGLLLTGGLQPDRRIHHFCHDAMDRGLPLLLTGDDTFTTAFRLSSMGTAVPEDDSERIEQVMETTAADIDVGWLKAHLSIDREPRLSPPAFRYLLSERARAAQKRIVLPEGDEPRTIRAAVACQERGLARCILLGNPDAIHKVARSQGVSLPESIEIIDPDSVRDRYIEPMVELRRHKGLAPDMAAAQLEDNVVLGTMMLAQDEVDGLVSGAVHTTANTIRPALQLIKTAPDARVVSSVFFMCLPEQVLVYGDCAVNPDPDAQALADIAIQSAESAETFGIAPRVAMISYSTGASGSGSEVDKVREATRLAQERRPDLPIDGPLQYDAAAIESVARSKAPDSPVAGRATVFIFPDLNTGNTTYKAVQRSANVISIGPMLQGLRKPVNDLSRGALVDDIIFTIALTAVQAEQARQKLEKQ